MIKRALVGLFFCLLATGVFAQDNIDTTILLKEISINSFRFNQFSDGNKQQKLDSTSKVNYMANTLADALNSLTTLYLKSYGISGNTSISLRGTTASHTAILWNGINLQDPLNGSSNLELISLQAIDEVSVQFGGSGALFGSGAIGGAILLESKAKFRTGFNTSINSGIGSFGNYFGNVSTSHGGKKTATSFRVFYRQAENDFSFVNTQQFGHPKTTQSNAAVKYFGINQDNRFLLSNNQQINTHLWIQKTIRELPPNMTMLISKQLQTDEVLRFSADYSLIKTKYDLMLRLGLLNSKLNYNDSLNGIYAEHQSKSAILETEFNYKLKINHLINIGLHERIDWAESGNYSQIQKRNNLAFLLSYKFWNNEKTLKISGSIRQELIDTKLSQPTPAFGLSYEIGKYFQLSSKISRNYRQPTFNDLYWFDGFAHGNPQLLSETAWSQDIALKFNNSNKYSNINLSINAFNIYVKNLILWIPVQGIWIPQNQKEVWSRGLETDFIYSRQFDKSKFKIDLHYSINPSTVQKQAENESDVILKKQLIYTPKQQLKAMASFHHLIGSISLEQIYVSKRFTMNDNTAWLEPYILSNLVISSNLKKSLQNFGISFRLNNLFDNAYQSMENYALPGRNYQLNFKLNIN